MRRQMVKHIVFIQTYEIYDIYERAMGGIKIEFRKGIGMGLKWILPCIFSCRLLETDSILIDVVINHLELRPHIHGHTITKYTHSMMTIGCLQGDASAFTGPLELGPIIMIIVQLSNRWCQTQGHYIIRLQ